MTTQSDMQQFYKLILAKHQDYWRKRKDILQEYMSLYTLQYYEATQDQPNFGTNKERRVELPHAFNAIETYVNQLFLVDPAVLVESDTMSQNDPLPVQTLCNRWLNSLYKTLEEATRLALIYPQSYLKIYADEGVFKPDIPASILSSIKMCALDPWDVIVDFEMKSFDRQRFAGHTYQITVAEAKSKFGNKEYISNSKEFLFDEDLGDFTGSISQDSTHTPIVPEEYRFIRIVELYDLIKDKLVIWTPDHSNGFKVLKECRLPIRDTNDEPMLPIIPMIFSWRPDNSLVGLSTMARGYSLFKELNDLRTHMANAVRTQTRKYLADKELFSERLAKGFMSASDGEVILVDRGQSQDKFDVNNFIQAVPFAEVSNDFQVYEASILRDIQQATLLGANAQGNITRASATEVAVVNQYAASDSAKMARQKAEAVQKSAETYIRTLHGLMAEQDNFQFVIEHQAGKKAGSISITKKDLDGMYQYTSLDQSNSPITKARKKEQYLQLIPILQQLGTPPDVIKEQLVAVFELPPELAKVPEPPKEELALPTDLSSLPPPEQLNEISEGGLI